jgi:hypothetical protein
MKINILAHNRDNKPVNNLAFSFLQMEANSETNKRLSLQYYTI